MMPTEVLKSSESSSHTEPVSSARAESTRAVIDWQIAPGDLCVYVHVCVRMFVYKCV